MRPITTFKVTAVKPGCWFLLEANGCEQIISVILADVKPVHISYSKGCNGALKLHFGSVQLFGGYGSVFFGTKKHVI